VRKLCTIAGRINCGISCEVQKINLISYDEESNQNTCFFHFKTQIQQVFYFNTQIQQNVDYENSGVGHNIWPRGTWVPRRWFKTFVLCNSFFNSVAFAFVKMGQSKKVELVISIPLLFIIQQLRINKDANYPFTDKFFHLYLLSRHIFGQLERSLFSKQPEKAAKSVRVSMDNVSVALTRLFKHKLSQWHATFKRCKTR